MNCLDPDIQQAITTIATLNGHNVFYTNKSQNVDGDCPQIRCSNCGYWLYAIVQPGSHSIAHTVVNSCTKKLEEHHKVVSDALLESLGLKCYRRDSIDAIGVREDDYA